MSSRSTFGQNTRSPRPLLIFGSALLLAAGALHAATYKWVDKNGVVHYSDQPQPGAEKVDLPQPQTYQAPPSARVRLSPATNPNAASAASCSITAPANDQAIVNQTSVTVTYVGPQGLTPVLYLNGQRSQTPGGAGAFVLSPIARGTYQATVAFTNDGAGAEVCRTNPITFHVRQASLLAPARPQGAGTAPRAPGAPRPR